MYQLELRKTKIKAAINDEEDNSAQKPKFKPRLSKWGGITQKIDNAKAKIDKRIGNDNRMVLHKMSQNNKFFLFEDKLQHVFKIYHLKNMTAKSFG